MYRLKLVVTGVAVLAALVVGCSRQTATPTSPSNVVGAGGNAAADGSTLKVTAPTPESPINDQLLTDSQPTLASSASTAKFGSASLQYRFQVFNPAGAIAQDSGLVGSTSFKVTADLEPNVRHTWRVRAESAGAFGPWSTVASFLTPDDVGYIRGNELYDPLTKGKTIGEVHGPVTFIPGVGVRLLSQESYISYELAQTLTEGEFSILVTQMDTNTDGGKTKLFAMGEGYSDIVTNDRRMTIEKRGDPAGIVAWRFITHDDQVDTEGPERQFVSFDASETYFWRATWRNNFFSLLINRGGVNGETIYEKGKPFDGRPYDPSPHVIYLGAPVGRSGAAGASVDSVTIRQVWVSGRPRPASANK